MFLGGAVGGAVGLFTSSVNPQIKPPGQTETVREIIREMKTTSLGYAKNFGLLGAVYAGIECMVETVCIKNENYLLIKLKVYIYKFLTQFKV